ncbi:retrovirus-related pol polyprotein from transposon TNT 1-94 [Tanacetum coccineum]
MIEKKTPMEMSSGHLSNYGMLRIFGCVAYPHDKQGKLEPRVIKCVLLGYPEGVKGYKLYRLDDESPKIVTSRNVVFNESNMYKYTLKDSGAGADKSVEYKAEEEDLKDGDDEDAVDQEMDQTPDKGRDLRRFDEYMLSNGFKRSSYDSCVYYRSYAPGEYIYLLLYVDDMLIACKSKAGIGSTKSLLKKEFDVKELKQVKKILGMEIIWDRSRKILRVSQSGYVSKILNNFRIDSGKSVKMALGGHFKLLLKDCPVRDCDVERMNRGNHVDLIGFVDLNYAKDPDKEAKYMALTEVVKEAIWLRGLLEELGVELNTVAVNYEGIMFFMKGLSTSICLDECGTWTQVTTLLGVAEYACNPLHLQTNDNNSGSLINIKLTGSENYKVWDTAMSIALQARNKMVFVDGLCVKSAYAPSIPLTNQWEDAEFGKHNQLMKLIQLLMGLDEVYQPIRSSLLTQIELPDVKDAFVIVCREEPHRSFGSVSGVQKPQSDMFEYGKQNTSSPYDDGEGPSDDAGEVPTYDSSNRTELDSPDVVNTRRSSKVSKLPDKLNDYVLDDKVKYGLNIFANHTKLFADNCCFISNLNKNNEFVKDIN